MNIIDGRVLTALSEQKWTCRNNVADDVPLKADDLWWWEGTPPPDVPYTQAGAGFYCEECLYRFGVDAPNESTRLSFMLESLSRWNAAQDSGQFVAVSSVDLRDRPKFDPGPPLDGQHQDVVRIRFWDEHGIGLVYVATLNGNVIARNHGRDIESVFRILCRSTNPIPPRIEVVVPALSYLFGI